ncbi:phage minor head protein [Riemerella columbipharyngis]|uniref:Phage putative head morphogenesis protein, SPP1 gp7 family n=1 Tax=Riemerella columbipharyngis TaxID=1071918 RepID=A0A1G7EIS4_9FLAO|nr:phage minor head protein [Riemerella columbipharyngis]SDE63579.1 phage putative head morphogenesis protein, SPP1 gp7 family [Riemerella columbipharyngis]
MGKFKQVLNYAEKAFKTLYEKQGYHPEDLAQITEYKGLINKTAEILSEQIPYETPAEMRQYLEQDVFVFSGLKTHAQLTEARSYLKDEQGNLRAYHDFEQKVLKLNEKYNHHYLEAEYEFAAHSAISASQWANLENDTERYWLEYRTAGDERVRASHDALRGVCLPKTDPFWDSFYPPNGWRCRCVAVEVLAREKTLTDSQKAQEMGEKATTQIGKNGKNKLAMFRFNAGKNKKIFPPENSYTKVVGAKEAKKAVEDLLKKDYEILLHEDTGFKIILSDIKKRYMEVFPKIDIEKRASVRMYTTSFYDELNKFNRKIGQGSPERKDFYHAITRTINKALDEIPDRFTGKVYRGVEFSKRKNNLDVLESYKKAFETGETIIEKAHLSTSYDEKSKFNGNVIFEIEAKNIAIIEKLSRFGSEKEALFKAGQEFKVTDVIDKGNDEYLIKMTQI